MNWSGRKAGAAAPPLPLFDEAWYLKRYPEVARAGIDAWRHYSRGGEARGYQPNPLFHPNWYWNRHANDIPPDSSPLAMFVARHGLDHPNPLFDPQWYRETHGLNPDTDPCSLTHYLMVGHATGMSPHPLFDSYWYDAQYPEVRAQGLIPLAHYLDVGEAAGYKPNKMFDPQWVRTTYLGDESDTAVSARGGVLHYYHAVGSRRGERPHPMFDVAWYRSRYPSVDAQGVDPLTHLLSTSRRDGHAPNGLAVSWDGETPSELLRRFRSILAEARRLAGSGLGSEANDTLTAVLGLDEPAMSGAIEPSKIELQPTGEEVEIQAPVVTVIIPTYNQLFHTVACVLAVMNAQTRTAFEVVVADDASNSSAALKSLLSRWPRLRVVSQQTNLGFVRNCNAAATAALGEYIVFLNNDTLPCDGWLDELLATFERFPNVGIVGSKLLFPNGSVAEAGGIVWNDTSAWNYGRHRAPEDRSVQYAREADYVSGASLMIRSDLFNQLGGFDDAFAPAYFEDTDLAFRVRRSGKRVIYQPNSEVLHFEGVSNGNDLSVGVKRHQDLNQEKFADRWRETVSGHGVRGHEPDREKDRYASRKALVLDACIPTPARDARSRRLFNMMKILRDDGYKVSFASEVFDAGAPFTDELRGSGIEVIDTSREGTIEQLLHREGAEFEVCLTARPAVADRWINLLGLHCPDARIIADDSDLRADEESTCNARPVTTRVSFLRDDSLALDRNTNVPHIYQPLGSPISHHGRQGVFLTTGFQDGVTVDSLMWLQEEIIPLIAEQGGHALSFSFRHRDWTKHLVDGCDDFQAIPERDLARPSGLDRFCVAVAPTRFGASLAGQIESVLARGIPCIATSRAASGIAPGFGHAIVIVDRAEEIADALVELLDNESRWRVASQAARAHIAAHFPYAAASETLLAAAR